MKKSTFILAASLILAASCAKEQVPVSDVCVLRGNLEETTDVKTYLSGNEAVKTHVSWAVADVANAFKKNNSMIYSQPLTADNISGEYQQMADFTFTGVKSSDLKYLVFPSEETNSINGDVISIVFPEKQTYALDNSFGGRANITVAKVVGNQANFKNIGALLKVSLSNDAYITNLKSIRLVADQFLSGKVSVNMSGDLPVATLKGESRSIYLSKDNQDFKKGRSYYFSVLPGTYTGLKVELVYSGGETTTYVNPTSLTIARNQVIELNKTPFAPKTNYTITSASDLNAIKGSGIVAGSLTFKGSGVTDQVWADAKTKFAAVTGTLVVDGCSITTTENLIGTSDNPPAAGYIDCKKAGFVFKNMSQSINFNAFKFFTSIKGNLVFENMPNDYSFTWDNSTCFHNLKSIGGDLIYRNSVFCNTMFIKLVSIGGDLVIANTVTGTTNGFIFWNFLNGANVLTKVGGNIEVTGNPSPTTLDGFWALERAGGIGGNVLVKGNGSSYDGQLQYYKQFKTEKVIVGSCKLYKANGSAFYIAD